MLDKKMTAVLEMLAAEVGYSYKVVKKQRLLAALPRRCGLDMSALLAIVAFLKENEYLVIKYQDKDELCLSLTVKAENYLTGSGEVSKIGLPTRQIFMLFLGVFSAAFLGALAANFVALLLR